MDTFNPQELEKLYVPPLGSHKGQNGKLMIIGGSHLFHAASLWSLTVATRVVDMVFYSSVPENNKIVQELKREFRDGIVVPRDQIEDYIKEADCVLIGPGMLRAERGISNLKDINELGDEGVQSYFLTKNLLQKYPKKKWVIDAGALQMMEPEWLLQLNGNVVLTPHVGEFDMINLKTQRSKLKTTTKNLKLNGQVKTFAQKYNCVVLLKGREDVVCGPFDSAQGEIRCTRISGGNAGMTKGGTGDVLAGLVAALACKNDLWLAATCASYINKKAGEKLFERVGYYFNSSDLADEIPRVMGELSRESQRMQQA